MRFIADHPLLSLINFLTGMTVGHIAQDASFPVWIVIVLTSAVFAGCIYGWAFPWLIEERKRLASIQRLQGE